MAVVYQVLFMSDILSKIVFIFRTPSNVLFKLVGSYYTLFLSSNFSPRLPNSYRRFIVARVPFCNILNPIFVNSQRWPSTPVFRPSPPVGWQGEESMPMSLPEVSAKLKDLKSLLKDYTPGAMNKSYLARAIWIDFQAGRPLLG